MLSNNSAPIKTNTQLLTKQSATAIASSILKGGSTFSFEQEADAFDRYQIPNISQCEFLALSPNSNVTSVKTSEKTIDLLSTSGLAKVGVIQTDQAKCICTTQKYIFVGSWNGKLSIYHV